jgi:peptidoglycan/xylan/chitin deacetylase (PgdA/CDA1 family)
MVPRLAALGCVAALAFAAVQSMPAAPAAEAGPRYRVSVSADGLGSPGSLIPAVVTLHGATRSTRAVLTLDTPRVRGTCVGVPWFNPVRRTLSRTCYAQLPTTRSPITLYGKAVVGGTTVRGAAARAFRPAGPVTTGRVTVARARAIERCGNTTSDVWLTFDDTISSAQVSRLLPVLARNGVRARFFLLGAWDRSNPGLRARLVAAGHLVMNHSYDHPALTSVSNAEVRRQIARGIHTRGQPRLLRPPYGAGAYTARLAALAREQGHQLCRWTTDTFDWQRPGSAVIAERLRYGDALTPPVRAGGVVLMHASHAASITAVQRVIDTIRAKGLRLDRLR